MKRFTMTGVLMLCLAVTLASQTPRTQRGIAAYVSPEDGNYKITDFTMQFNRNNRLMGIKIDSDVSLQQSLYDTSGNFVKLEIIVKAGEIAAALKHDRRVISREEDKLHFTFYQAGEEVKQKRIDASGVLIFDDLFLLLPEKLRQGEGDFSGKLVFSEFFREGSRLAEEALVYEIGLKGLASLFFPHKLYFAYSTDAEPRFIAYWGGDPKMANFWLAAEE